MIWVKRIVIVLAGLLALGFIAFNVFKAQIAERVFERAVERNAGRDASAELPDGLHVYMCGTGAPMPDASRAGPCLGVLAGEQAFVFDIGSGGARKLGAMGFPVAKLEAVYLTHLHSDHIDGLGEFLLVSWIAGQRSSPTPVKGPTGTGEIIDGLNMVYRIDSTYRVAHHGPEVANPNGYGGVATEITLPMGPASRAIVYQNGDLTITAVRVDHHPVEPAFGYRIDYKGRSVTISGDTVYHPGFVEISKGADLMLHEALSRKMVKRIGEALGRNGQANASKIFADILDYHTDPEEAAKAAEEAGVDQLVLYHIVPQIPIKLIEPVFLGKSKSIFSGKLTLAEDGMLFTLPAGSDKIIRDDLF